MTADSSASPRPPLVVRALRRLYRVTRPWMPPVRRVRFAGVPTPGWIRVSDLIVPVAWRGVAVDQPGYEDALITGLRAQVRPGDRVVVVGGGMGVTSVVAANAAGPDGTVDTFEASDHMLASVRQTLRLSPSGERVRLHHAVVGAAYGVYGETSAALVAADALPPCDVLMLDCEGAERDVIPSLTQRPRAILVETHGLYDSPTDLVSGLLVAAGYRIVSEAVAEPRVAAYCEEHDIRVLVAVHDEAPSPA